MSVRVLIVDNSPVARQIIRYHLMLYGCRIVGEAGSASEAYNLYRQHNPNLITLDLMMPGVGGIDTDEVFRRIKAEVTRHGDRGDHLYTL